MNSITAQSLVYGIRQITGDIDPTNQRFRLPKILAALDRGLLYLNGKVAIQPQVSSSFLTLQAGVSDYVLGNTYQYLASFNYGKNGAPIRRESILVWQQYMSMNPNSIGQPLIVAMDEDYANTGTITFHFWPKPFEIQTIWATYAFTPGTTFLGMASQDLTTISIVAGPYGSLSLQHWVAGDLQERENGPQSRGAGARDLALADEYRQMESNRVGFQQAGEGRLASVI